MRAKRGALAGLVGWISLLLLIPTWVVADPQLPDGFQDEVVIDGLQEPTAFQIASDGRVFVAEKTGLIEVFDDFEDDESTVFADLRTQVYDTGDRGLLGLALDPDFPAEPYVYALYTYDHLLGDPEPAPKWGSPETTGDPCPKPGGADVDACPVSGRLVRLTAGEGGVATPEASAPSELVLVEGWCQQFSSHSIGDLQFGPEGALYASGGDGASFTGVDYGQFGWPEKNLCGDPPGAAGEALEEPTSEGGALRAQNNDNLSGTLIRISPATGAGWPGNPMDASLDANQRRVVGYGFRNPFRFAIDPEGSGVYVGNVGWSEFEEIDAVDPEAATPYNSGWPCYEGFLTQYLYDDYELDVCAALYKTPGSTAKPLLTYSHGGEIVVGDECPFGSGSAVSAIAFYEDGSYPAEYDGGMFFADSVRGCVYWMARGKGGSPDPETTTPFLREGSFYPGVDLDQGPDGNLYYAGLYGPTGPGEIHRIVYVPGAPRARLDVDQRFGPTPLNAEFDASASTDPDEDPLEFEWDLDEDGIFETLGGETQSLELTASENFTAAVRVTDGTNSSVARLTVYPGDSPPVPTIEFPTSGLTWEVGQSVYFQGSALNSESKKLFGQAMRWSVRLSHCPFDVENCHLHPLQSFVGVSSGNLVAPDHEYPSYIEVILEVTDKRGLAETVSRKIYPKTVELGIGSEPAGVTVNAAIVSQPTPYSLTAIRGSTVALSTPATAVISGRSYEFDHWSDGGGRTHSVTAASSADYTAIYREVEGKPEPPSNAKAPRTKLLRHPAKRTASRRAKFAFTSTPRAARYRCRLDRSRWRNCHSPKAFKGLRPGRHVFRVYAIGVGGRDRTPARFAWKIVKRPQHRARAAHRRR